MLSPSLEDYLEEAYRLIINNKEIRIKDVVWWLNVSISPVVRGFRKLNRLGHIIYRPYEKIELIDRGKILSRSDIIRSLTTGHFLYGGSSIEKLILIYIKRVTVTTWRIVFIMLK